MQLIGTYAGVAEVETRFTGSVQEKYRRRRLVEDSGLPERLEEYIKRAGCMKMLELKLPWDGEEDKAIIAAVLIDEECPAVQAGKQGIRYRFKGALLTRFARYHSPR